jgi:hypothetical protein
MLPDGADAGATPPAPVESAPVDTVEQALICGAEDWDYIDTFDDQAAWLPAIHYGKAAARIGGCSSTLYDDRWLVTADHCSIGNGPRTVTFGMFDGAEAYARGRLRDLGMAGWEVDRLDFDDISKFSCRNSRNFFNRNDGYRDVEVWECEPNTYDALGDVYPGDIWGHAHISPGRRPDGRDLYAVTVNRPHGRSRGVLLSPTGEVNDGNDACAWFGDYDNCFEHNVDTKPGSSGGGIFERHSKRMIGVVNGNSNAWFEANQCDGETNHGAYLPSAGRMPRSQDVGQPLPPIEEASFGGWAGGYGGTARTFACPEGKMAAGIIGTTYRRDPEFSRRVGNFGIVCVPYTEERNLTARSSTHWDVLVGGSIDNGPAGIYPFDEYINERLDAVDGNGNLKSMNHQQQGLTMCEPGEFLAGVEAFRDGNVIGHIDRIRCRSARSSHNRTPRYALGDEAITPDESVCPFQQYVNGITIRSGWLTDGFGVWCRTL